MGFYWIGADWEGADGVGYEGVELGVVGPNWKSLKDYSF